MSPVANKRGKCLAHILDDEGHSDEVPAIPGAEKIHTAGAEGMNMRGHCLPMSNRQHGINSTAETGTCRAGALTWAAHLHRVRVRQAGRR